MSVSWLKDKKEVATKILKHLTENITTNASESISFANFSASFDYSNDVVFLYDCLQFDQKIPEQIARSFVKQVIKEFYNQEITTEKFLGAIQKLTNQHLLTPSQKYVLVTSVSIDKTNLLPSMKINGTTISFERALPKKFRVEREKLLQNHPPKRFLFSDEPTDYMWVLVFVSARSPLEAMNLALDNFNLVRAIWNWFYNRHNSDKLSIGIRKAINQIGIGPIHTLHTTSGELIPNTKLWYEGDYRTPVKAKDIKSDLPQISAFYKQVTSYLKPLNYRTDIESFLIRYVQALDDIDLTTSFLKLWSVLEDLTSTNAGNKYDITIKRASSIFEDEDAEYIGQILHLAKNHRNQWVHTSETTQEIDRYLYKLKLVVEELFEFHLVNRFKFSRLKDTADFLDTLSLNINELNKHRNDYNHKLQLIKNALKYKNIE